MKQANSNDELHGQILALTALIGAFTETLSTDVREKLTAALAEKAQEARDLLIGQVVSDATISSFDRSISGLLDITRG